MTPIEELLNSGHSKKITNDIVNYINGNEEKFADLIRCFTSISLRLTQRASWAISGTLEKWPSLIAPYHAGFLELLKDENQHDSIQRNILRAYQWAEISEGVESELYDVSIKNIQNSDKAIAIRVFSMTVAYRIVKKYNELAPELQVSIESALQHASGGMKSRGNKILMNLHNL